MNPFKLANEQIKYIVKDMKDLTNNIKMVEAVQEAMENYKLDLLRKGISEEAKEAFWKRLEEVIKDYNCRWLWNYYRNFQTYFCNVNSVIPKLPFNCNIENKMGLVTYISKYDIDMDTEYFKYREVYLPLTTEELDRYLMEQGIKNKEDCQVKSISCELDGLENAVNSLLYPDKSSPVNMDIYEWNYLFHLVSKMSDEEQSVFCNTLTLHPPRSIKDLINQTANLDKVCIASNIYTTKQLGEFLIENDFYDFDIEIIPLLDASKLAEQHMVGNKGMIDKKNGLYIEDTASPEERVVIYDGEHLPRITEHGIEENNMEPELDTGPLQQW